MDIHFILYTLLEFIDNEYAINLICDTCMLPWLIDKSNYSYH